MKNVMTTQRKVRKDFNPAKEYSVNVECCSEDVKKEVQQAFFDAGFPWLISGKEYQYLDAVQYSNARGCGDVTEYCMYRSNTKGCNMLADEFLELVYEPEKKGHVHAELMLQYAEDAKTHAEPWELWQTKGDARIWWDCRTHPMWGKDTKYRRKTKTHFVHGVEIPDLRVSPKYGEYYYLADPTESEFTYLYLFHGDTQDNRWSERGLTYQPTEEGKQAAKLHAKAMLGMLESTQD